MKIVVSVVVLVNLLGFLMMTNIPPQPDVNPGSSELQPPDHLSKLRLLSELSPREREAPDVLPESKSDSSGTLESTQCFFIGPFSEQIQARDALVTLVPGLADNDQWIVVSKAAEFWLKIPALERSNIPPQSWAQFAAKKRSLEDCMKVANTPDFH